MIKTPSTFDFSHDKQIMLAVRKAQESLKQLLPKLERRIPAKDLRKVKLSEIILRVIVECGMDLIPEKKAS